MKPPDGHQCTPHTITYEPGGGAQCECGRRWYFTRDSEGKPLGYVTPPTTPAERRKAHAGWWE